MNSRWNFGNYINVLIKKKEYENSLMIWSKYGKREERKETKRRED